MKNPFAKEMLNKVPEVTLYFWIIKILCTTIGETAADLLNMNLHRGLTLTTYFMGVLWLIALAFQLRLKKYVPSIYWITVVLISVVGTLITDNMTDNFHISLVTSTIVFSVALIATFIAWYQSEKTLSIHSIFTTRRETFYWLAILFTFALGTAAGDLVAERLQLGYLVSGCIFGGLIALTTLAHYRFKLDAIWAFWIAYILTRPFGASIADYLSQPHRYGGLGFGVVNTSAVFFILIIGLVMYLSITRKDVLVD